jgi:hypothetical protein
MNSDSFDKHQFARNFVGSIPPFLLFEMEFHSLFHLVESHKTDKMFEKPNPATEVALIGLVAHFEAFCKHQFAAIANLSSTLLSDFAERRSQTAIRLVDLMTLHGQFEQNIGFLVAEHYDFGSAELINGLFRDLITVSPFTKFEGNQFNDILRKRHLLVHHAGYYTLQFLKDSSLPGLARDQAFRDSVQITTEAYHEVGDFMFEMAMKTARVTVAGAVKTLSNRGLADEPTFAAANEMLKGLYDNLDYHESPGNPPG